MSWGFGSGITDTVKKLLIINGICFVLEYLFPRIIIPLFALNPQVVVSRFFIWQFVTYMFLHSRIDHIGWNMFLLWMFGSEIERMWGPKAFLKYYLITGIGAGIIHVIFSGSSAIGASGAIMGVLVAFALMFPDRRVMLLFPPILLPAKILVLIYAGIDILIGVSGSPDGIAHFAHLGGALVGYLYLKYDWRWSALKKRFEDWQRKRRMRVVHRQEEEKEKLRRLVDQVLDKANDVGMENLTRDEKLLLKKASQILNQEKD